MPDRGRVAAVGGGVLVASLLWLGSAAAALSAEPPSCADQYPADGPAGIDLRLGCIVREVVGHGTGTNPAAGPAPISSYLLPLAGLVALVVASWLLVGRLRREAGRRLAPVLPEAWWSCGSCHSINAVGTGRCYACGMPWTPDAVVVPTSDRPGTP